MQYILSAALVLVAIIHLLPLAGVLGARQLQQLYGVPVAEPNLEILMRHRAVLFGLLGGFMLVAAFYQPLQPAAWVMGFVSVLSFLGLARSVGAYNTQLRRVVVADVVALVALLIGATAHALSA